MDIRYVDKKLDMLTMDVTNHCNARCIFCFNDWDALKPHSMDLETFRNTARMLPMLNMDSGQFLVSCWYEPTISRQFYDILDELPAEYADRTYFTTNLVTVISDEQIERMCSANVHHINVSLESYDPETYRKLTNVKGGHFYENLQRLADCARTHKQNLHLISMLTRSNLEEFPQLIERAHNELHPAHHEIRTPFFFIEETGQKQDLIEGELLWREEINEVRKKVEALGYDNLEWHCGTSKKEFLDFDAHPDKYWNCDVVYRVRVNADGSARIGHHKKGLQFNVNDCEDPIGLLKKEMISLQKEDVENYLVPADALHMENGINGDPFSTDELFIYDHRFFQVRGWAAAAAKIEKGQNGVVVMERNGRYQVVRMRPETREDVAGAFGQPEWKKSGFQAFLDFGPDGEGNAAASPYAVYAGFLDGQNVVLRHLLYESAPGAGQGPVPQPEAAGQPAPAHSQKKGISSLLGRLRH